LTYAANTKYNIVSDHLILANNKKSKKKIIIIRKHKICREDMWHIIIIN
jgi:hypothetical protein